MSMVILSMHPATERCIFSCNNNCVHILSILTNLVRALTRSAKLSVKRPLGRPRRRWEDNIRMDLEEIGINAGNWVDPAQDRN